MSEEKLTPLYDRHVALGAKMVPFAGYIMPIQYEGIIKEHLAVRNNAGLFDVSHMGEVIIEGPDALKAINYLLTNDFTNLKDNGIRYSLLCNENGGVVDDLLVYRYNQDKYMFVLNASNCDKDIAFMKERLSGDVTLTNISEETAEVALQGPESENILGKIVDSELLPKKYYTFSDDILIEGASCLVSRTGYTGEDGFEIYCPFDSVGRIWDKLLEVGRENGIEPAGLGARDTLRLEAGMPLYGHELEENISPFDSSLGFAVKMIKEDFVGKSALISKEQTSIGRVGLKVNSRGIAREGCRVLNGDTDIGYITSGTHLPYLDGAYAMALIDRDFSSLGTELKIDVRGRLLDAEIVALPFYKRG